MLSCRNPRGTNYSVLRVTIYCQHYLYLRHSSLRSVGTIAQWQAEVISLTGTVKFHSLNLFDFWKKCEACLTAGYTIACKRVTEGVPQHPKIKQKVQAARPFRLKDIACDSWTKKRSTGISVCRDLLHTFRSRKVCDKTTTRRINDNR